LVDRRAWKKPKEDRNQNNGLMPKTKTTMIRIAAFLVVMLISGPSLAQEFHIVFLNKKEDKANLPEEEVKKLMDAHMANIERLAKEGKLWAAGPFEGGGGIFIFKSASAQDVRNWIQTDAAVAAGRWNVEILPYLPRIGSVCTVGEGYEMTNYFFVRYAAGPATRDMLEAHNQYLNSKAIIAEGGFGDGNGRMTVFKEDPTATWLNEDPAVKGGYFVPGMKKLFIARGSFCEAR